MFLQPCCQSHGFSYQLRGLTLLMLDPGLGWPICLLSCSLPRRESPSLCNPVPLLCPLIKVQVQPNCCSSFPTWFCVYFFSLSKPKVTNIFSYSLFKKLFLHLGQWSISNQFLYMVYSKGWGWLVFLTNGYSIVPAPFIVKINIFPLNCLAMFVENQLPLYVWVYF